MSTCFLFPVDKIHSYELLDKTEALNSRVNAKILETTILFSEDWSMLSTIFGANADGLRDSISFRVSLTLS